MNDLAHVESGRLQVHFHPGQWQAWQSRARFVLVLAGTQGGKTSYGPLAFYKEIQECGPGDYIVATPTFQLLELKLLPEFRKLFERQLGLGRYIGSPSRKFVFSEAGAKKIFGERYDPSTPTQVFFGHAQDPDSLESATAKAAWLDEAGQKKFKRSSWEAILRRLSIHMGRVLITTTPYGAFGWIKTELYDRWKKGDPTIEVINFESRMNPAFPEAEWERAKETLPKWKFDLMYRGLLTKPAGLIYDVFDEEQHVVDPIPIPDSWARAWGFDFGGVHLACLKFAIDPEGVWWLYDEYMTGKRTAKQHTDMLTAGQTLPAYCFGGSGSEDNWRAEFTQAGLKINPPPIKDVEVGILRFYGLVKQNRVRIFRTCAGTIEELETYSRKLDENNEPTEDIEDKSTFHRLDAARYIAAGVLEPEPKDHYAPKPISRRTAR